MKNNKKKIIIIILSLVAILFIITGVILLFSKKEETKEKETPTVKEKVKKLYICEFSTESEESNENYARRNYEFVWNTKTKEITVLKNDFTYQYSTKEEYDEAYANIHNPEMHQNGEETTYEYDEENLIITFQDKNLLYEKEIDKTKENWTDEYLELINTRFGCVIEDYE